MIPFTKDSRRYKTIYQKANQWLPGIKRMGKGRGGGRDLKGCEETWGGGMFIILIVVMVSQVYTCSISNCTLYAQFIKC